MEDSKSKFRFSPYEDRVLTTDSANEYYTTQSIGFWASARKKFTHDYLGMSWLIVLIIIILAAWLGPMLQHLNPNQIDVNSRNMGISATHWFGTDRLGRDLFTRACIGVRISLTVAILSTFIAIGFGTFYGMIMAFFGGKVDNFMMRVIEVFNSLPSLLITMLIMIILGNGVGSMLFALAFTSWSGSARQARGLVLQLRERDYVTSAIMLNTPPWLLMLRHFVPNMMSILILDIGQSIPGNIFGEASLSFLGMGIKAPNTSLGILISDGQNQMLQHPIQLYIPVLILLLIVFAFNIVGDGLRDALDPKYKR
ncbi:Oligopeptide transport system permease protein oppC [Listeria grayi]|uniref:Oligopeptide ABC transporter permease n=1 Tax=Listeria grayi FSL F6-1183 TaxID=1265827 RepID=A0A829R3J7_LISGR|nr:ABC transporter permease [Listeria grayi]EUJ26602.1 oligopeptide ABC transporter permease [Listeria grayi FSL F6-1183]VEI35878.1 Oligopeptide transport system permease protein oppC [Listeria grayi]